MASFIYLKDAGAQIWRVGVTDSGELTTLAVPSGLVLPLTLSDYQGSGVSFSIGITTAGELAPVNIGLVPAPLNFQLASANGTSYFVTVRTDLNVSGRTVGDLVTWPNAAPGAYPKIVYPSSLVAQIPPTATLVPRWQPCYVPAYIYEVERFDNIADSGVRESIYLRTDVYWEATIEWMALGSDLESWRTFMGVVLQGIPFDYYPDKTQSAFTTYHCEDKVWTTTYKYAGFYTFKTRWRKRLPWPS